MDQGNGKGNGQANEEGNDGGDMQDNQSLSLEYDDSEHGSDWDHLECTPTDEDVETQRRIRKRRRT